jgi:hypothetical protein
MATEEKPPKSNGAPPAPISDDPDKEFWEAEGVTDPDEQEAIKSRARVLRYADYRRKKDEEAAKNPKKKKSGRPWYKEE